MIWRDVPVTEAARAILDAAFIHRMGMKDGALTIDCERGVHPAHATSLFSVQEHHCIASTDRQAVLEVDHRWTIEPRRPHCELQLPHSPACSLSLLSWSCRRRAEKPSRRLRPARQLDCLLLQRAQGRWKELQVRRTM